MTARGERRYERGVALITVLALIASIGVLVASSVAMSQYSTAETDTFLSLQRSALEAESAANRILWMLLADRAKHADRKLGGKSNTEEEREQVTRAARFGLAALDHRDLG